MVQAVWQLRALVCGLGAMLLVLSVAFNVFVWKQSRNIAASANGRKLQLMQAETRLDEMTRIANAMASYSMGKPELVAIFSRFGIEVKQPPVEPATSETGTH
jgi:hypothetical protein